ncbi:MAG: hypothetical protein QM601_14045 [Pseudoxanthomonas sp.]
MPRSTHPHRRFRGQHAMILGFASTHAYPGCHGRLLDAHRLHAGRCTVEFADGHGATARLQHGDAGWILAIAAHTTARGTRIAAKRWRLQADAAAVRIIRRLPDEAPSGPVSGPA